MVLWKNDLTGKRVVGVWDGVVQNADAAHDLQRGWGKGWGKEWGRGWSSALLTLTRTQRDAYLSNLLHSLREVVR